MKLSKTLLLFVTALLFFGQIIVPIGVSKSTSQKLFSVHNELQQDDAVPNDTEKKDTESDKDNNNKDKEKDKEKDKKEEEILDEDPPTTPADPGAKFIPNTEITDKQLPWLIGLPIFAVIAFILLTIRRKRALMNSFKERK